MTCRRDCHSVDLIKTLAARRGARKTSAKGEASERDRLSRHVAIKENKERNGARRRRETWPEVGCDARDRRLAARVRRRSRRELHWPVQPFTPSEGWRRERARRGEGINGIGGKGEQERESSGDGSLAWEDGGKPVAGGREDRGGGRGYIPSSIHSAENHRGTFRGAPTRDRSEWRKPRREERYRRDTTRGESEGRKKEETVGTGQGNELEPVASRKLKQKA